MFMSLVMFPFDGSMRSVFISMNSDEITSNFILAKSGICIEVVKIGRSGAPSFKVDTPPGAVIFNPSFVASRKYPESSNEISEYDNPSDSWLKLDFLISEEFTSTHCLPSELLRS